MSIIRNIIVNNYTTTFRIEDTDTLSNQTFKGNIIVQTA